MKIKEIHLELNDNTTFVIKTSDVFINKYIGNIIKRMKSHDSIKMLSTIKNDNNIFSIIDLKAEDKNNKHKSESMIISLIQQMQQKLQLIIIDKNNIANMKDKISIKTEKEKIDIDSFISMVLMTYNPIILEDNTKEYKVDNIKVLINNSGITLELFNTNR